MCPLLARRNYNRVLQTANLILPFYIIDQLEHILATDLYLEYAFYVLFLDETFFITSNTEDYLNLRMLDESRTWAKTQHVLSLSLLPSKHSVNRQGKMSRKPNINKHLLSKNNMCIYYMAEFASKQDEMNPAFWLATRVSKMGLSIWLRIFHVGPAGKSSLFGHVINPLLTNLVW